MSQTNPVALPSGYRIGPDGRYELRRQTRELLNAGSPIDVQPKVLDLIVFLVDNRHRAVDKNELQDAIWPRQVVTETALTRAIMKARRAFGDDVDLQRVIRTVHSRGYQFVAAVQPADDVNTEPAGPRTTDARVADMPAVPPRRVRRQPWLSAGVVALLAVIAAAMLAYSHWLGDDSPPPDSDVRVAVLPIEVAKVESRHDWARLGLMDAIHEVLRNGHGVAVVSVRDVMRLAERERDPEVLARQLRLALGATHVLSARLQQEGDGLQLEYSLRDASGAVRQRRLAGSDIATLARGVAADLSVIFGRATLGTPASKDPLANEAYLRGRALALQGDLKGAQELFRLAREQAPDAFWPAYEYALTVRDLGNADDAQTLLEALLTRARRDGDPDAEIAASNALAILLLRGDRVAEAESLLLVALEIAAPRDDPQELGVLLGTLAIAQRERGDLDAARASMLRVLESDARRGVPSSGTTYNGLAQIELRRGDLAGAEQHLQRAIAAFRLIGNERTASYPLNGLANLRMTQGRYAEADKLAEEALAIRRSASDRRGQAISLLTLAATTRATGRLADALANADAAVALSADLRDEVLHTDALAARAAILRERGAIAAADAQAREVLARREQAADRVGALAARIELARIGAASGDSAGARRALEIMLTDAEPWPEVRGDVALELARLSLDEGDAMAAEAGYERVLVLATGHTGSRAAAHARLGLIELALARGDAASARTRLAELGDALPEEPARWRALAALAAADGATATALAHERRAKQLSGERWSDADEARLAKREAAVTATAG